MSRQLGQLDGHRVVLRLEFEQRRRSVCVFDLQHGVGTFGIEEEGDAARARGRVARQESGDGHGCGSVNDDLGAFQRAPDSGLRGGILREYVDGQVTGLVRVAARGVEQVRQSGSFRMSDRGCGQDVPGNVVRQQVVAVDDAPREQSLAREVSGTSSSPRMDTSTRMLLSLVP